MLDSFKRKGCVLFLSQIKRRSYGFLEACSYLLLGWAAAGGGGAFNLALDARDLANSASASMGPGGSAASVVGGETARSFSADGSMSISSAAQAAVRNTDDVVTVCWKALSDMSQSFSEATAATPCWKVLSDWAASSLCAVLQAGAKLGHVLGEDLQDGAGERLAALPRMTLDGVHAGVQAGSEVCRTAVKLGANEAVVGNAALGASYLGMVALILWHSRSLFSPEVLRNALYHPP